MAATTPNPDPAATEKEKAAREKVEREKAEARLELGASMMRIFGEVALASAALGGKGALLGLKGAMPLLELYAGTTRKAEQDSDTDGSGLESLGLSRGESVVVRRAFTKAMLEAIEISSVTHPVYASAPAYRSLNAAGGIEAPQMLHLLALGAAAAALWKRWDSDQKPPPKPEPEPVQTYAAQQTVAYVAVRPGEYQYLSAPLPPSDIRRYAMRQRSLNQPQMAMLAYSGNPASVIATPTRMGANQRVSYATAEMTSVGATSPRRSTGCGCGAAKSGGCSCGTSNNCGCGPSTNCSCNGHAGHAVSAVRHDADGNCEGLFSISCETRWRIRECVKVSFCDLLRCMGDEFCERPSGKRPDISGCLEDFLCSLLHCLPDAICPPPAAHDCCPPRQISSCHCNYAVGE